MIEYLYEVLFMLLEISSYVLGYAILFNARFTKKVWIFFLAAGFYAGAEAVAAYAGNIYFMYDFSPLFCLVIPLLFMEQRHIKWFLLYPSIWISVTTFDIAITYLVSLLLQKPESEVLLDGILPIMCEFITLVIMIFTRILQCKLHLDEKEILVDRRQYLVIYLGAGFSYIIVDCAQTLTSDKHLSLTMNTFMSFSMVVACLAFFLLCFWQGRLRGSEEKYKMRSEEYQMYIHMQEKQIANMILADEGMRRYRHDLNAHITVIEGMAEQSNNKEILRYLDQLGHHMKSSKKDSLTGNVALDSVLNQQFRKMYKEDIRVICDVHFSEECQLLDVELCSLVYNLTENAITACMECLGKKEIQIQLYPYEQQTFLTIKNTCEKGVVIQNHCLVTSKEDALNHGYGSINVRDIIEKCHGSVHYSNQKGWFCVEIVV